MRSATPSVLAVALVLAPVTDPKASEPPVAEAPALALEVTSVGCDVEDAELERLLVLELRDLPQAERGFALHVELRCEFSEIGIIVREPVRGTSLQRTLESPEAAVGRERVLALAIRQLVDTSFLELVTRGQPSLDPPERDPANALDLDHGSEQASQGDRRAPAARPSTSDEPLSSERPAQRAADEPAPAPADLVAGGGPAPAQGADAPAPAPGLAPVRLGLELGVLGRSLDARALAAARAGVFVEGQLGRRWSLIGALASDWSTVAAPGGRIHAVDLVAGFGARARLDLGRGPFLARLGGDLELGWGRVLGVADSGFAGARIDSVVVGGRLVAGVWAEGPRGALGLDLLVGGGPRTPVGTVPGAREVSLGGAFVGLVVGTSWRLR